KKAVVLVFLSFECPVSNSYAGPLTELGKKYTDKGVTVVGICAVDEDEVVAAAKQVQEFKVGFPVYYDTKRVSVDALKAEVTPEAFVLDHNFVLRYRGRIDNGWTTRLKRNLNITEHTLRTALDEMLDGKPVSIPATEAIGCFLNATKAIKTTGKV